jgi:FMN phosphatase YigB (HAD superfamily)
MRVVCFDFWNTLARSLQGGGASYADVLVRLGAKPEAIYPIVRDELMVGIFDYEQMVTHICSRFRLAANSSDIAEAVANWARDNERAAWFDGAVDLLDALCKQGDQRVLITNITAPAWEAVNVRLDVTSHFDTLFLSCVAGFSKPDPRAWDYVEQSYPNASEYWMIGDNVADDLAIPVTMGWKTILAGTTGVPLAEIPQIIHRGGAR